MSLQVWLPLNGDLKNWGLSGLAFSNLSSSNTTVNNSGKIGKCFNNNLSSAGGLLSNTTIELGQTQSMFCWFKFTSLVSTASLGGGLVSQHRYSANTGMGITIKYVSSTTGYLSINTGTGSSRTYNTYCGTTLLQANTWYHGGYTFNNGVVKIYVNGVCEYTGNIGTMSVPADYITIFCWSMSGSSGNSVHGSYKLNGYLNDVRIYDHCLSPKEVEEIAKGLVLHYKLDNNGMGGENLLTNSTGFSGAANWTGLVTVGDENGHPYLIAKRTNTTSTSRTSCYHNPAITSYVSSWQPGDKFTLSGYYKVPSSETQQTGGNMFIRWIRSDGSYGDTGFTSSTTVTDTWIRFAYTYSVPSNYAGGEVNFYLSAFAAQKVATVYWKDVKLEKGSIATDWSPAKADANYPAGYNTIVFDSSGYSNNGTISGTLTAAADTPRYDVATQFPNGTDNIQSNFSLAMPTFSCSFWFKPKSTDGGYCIIASNKSNASPYWWIAANCESSKFWFYNGYYCSTGGTLTNDTWYHGCFVFNNKVGKWYINGVEQTLNKNTLSSGSATGNITNLSVGNSYTGSSWNTKDYGQIVDFRLYATALTAAQVAELYNTSMSIDSNGNVYARELSEL